MALPTPISKSPSCASHMSTRSSKKRVNCESRVTKRANEINHLSDQQSESNQSKESKLASKQTEQGQPSQAQHSKPQVSQSMYSKPPSRINPTNEVKPLISWQSDLERSIDGRTSKAKQASQAEVREQIFVFPRHSPS